MSLAASPRPSTIESLTRSQGQPSSPQPMLPKVGAHGKMGDNRAVRWWRDHDEPFNIAGIVERVFNAIPGDETAHRVANKNHFSAWVLLANLFSSLDRSCAELRIK